MTWLGTSVSPTAVSTPAAGPKRRSIAPASTANPSTQNSSGVSRTETMSKPSTLETSRYAIEHVK